MIAEALAVLIVLGTVYALLLGGRVRPFRPGAARTSVRRASGGNMASILAVVAVAALVLEAAGSPVVSSIPGIGPVLAGIVVVLIIGVVVNRSITELVIGGLALVVLATQVGAGGTIALVILVALMLWMLGAARGFLR